MLLGGAAMASAQLRAYPTVHYRLLTDVEDEFARDLARRLDAMHDEYAQRLALFRPGSGQPARLDVYVFQKREDYVRLTDHRLPNTGGVFMAGRNLLAVFVEGQGREATRHTLQHEAFHQFAHARIGPNLPIWVNEGLAQLFEEGIWTGRSFAIGQVPPRRLRQLRADLDAGRLVPFRDFLRLDDKGWADGFADRERIATQYNQAWAMVHFLVYAADPDGRPRFRARFVQFLRLLGEGVDGDLAWQRSFSANYDGFEARFREWAQTLQPTREADWLEQQDVLADMLVLLAEKGTRFDSIAEFREHVRRTRPRLHYARGTLRWSTDPDPTAYFRDAAGNDLAAEQLAFVLRAGAPLPDLLYRPVPGVQMRTRFWRQGAGIEHETLFESLSPPR